MHLSVSLSFSLSLSESGDLQGFKALLAWAGFNWFNLAAVTVAIMLELAVESTGSGNDDACHYCLAL